MSGERVRFVDSHCHLDNEQYAADRADVIQRAVDAGVDHFLAIGTGDGPPDLEAGIRIAGEDPRFSATIGIHPNDAPKADDETFLRLTDLLQHPKVKAVGEIGLDYYWEVPKAVQEPIFIRQMEIAAEHRFPIVIHTRDAWDDTYALLKAVWAPSGLPCVMHCFTGDVRQAERFLELGCYLAFGGVLTFSRSADVQAAARLTPLDRLLLETDAPYLAPMPHRGKRNEPAYVVRTAEKLAEVCGVSLEKIAGQTTANFFRMIERV